MPSFGWARAVGGASGEGVATDAVGDVYMAGTFSTPFTPAGSSVPLTSAGSTDVFVTKYSRSGAFLWAISVGGTQDDSCRDIAVDSGGSNVYVVGESGGLSNTVNLDGMTGTVRWSQVGTNDRTVSVAADTMGNAYTVNSGGSATSVTKLDTNGNQQWQTTMTGAVPTSIAVTGSNVYVGGNFGPSATFSTGSGNVSINGSSSFCGFVLNITTDNGYDWVRTFQGTLKGNKVQGFLPSGFELAADDSGNVYAAGTFLGTVNFANSSSNTGPFVLVGSGNGSTFVTKLNANGTTVWAKKFGDATKSNANLGADLYSIAVDSAGAVYTTGVLYSGTTSFNPAGGGNLTSAGATDIFVSKLNTNGVYQWAVRAGGAGGDVGYGICVNSFGDIYTTGYISAGTTDFDPANTYSDNRDLITATERTGFLWQIEQP